MGNLVHSNDLSTHPLPIEGVLEREIEWVAPDTFLVDVVTRLSRLEGSCALPGMEAFPIMALMGGTKDGCVLVMENARLTGIFTERDAVRLAALGINFAAVRVRDVVRAELVTLTYVPGQNLFAALTLFRLHRIRHLPVLDQTGEVMGIVTADSIRRALQPANLLTLRTAGEVMQRHVIHAPPKASVLDLAKLMVLHEVSCVVVAKTRDDVGVLPVGIVTERDIVQFRFLEMDLERTTAEMVMSTPLFALSPRDSLLTAHQQMQQRHVGRLVVSGERGELVGILTQTSLFQVLDPIEIFGVVQVLQQTVDRLEAEKVALLQDQNLQLSTRLEQNTAQLRWQAETLSEQAALIEMAQDAIFICDAQGRIVSWNRGAEQLYGWTEQEVQGQSLHILLATVFSTSFEQVQFLLLETGHWGGELTHTCRDGTQVLVESRQVVMRGTQGEVKAILEINRDITMAKRVEEALRQSTQRLGFALEAAELGEWSMNLQDHTASRSLRHDQIFGYEELLPQWTYEMFLKHVLDEDRPVVNALFEVALSEGGAWNFECRIRRADGTIRWISARGRVWQDAGGKPERMLGAVGDITERKLIQFEREDLLERERTSRALAEEANRIKDEFLATLSHELRSPLNAMLGWVQILRGRRLDAATQARGLEVIERNARSQNKLIEDLLDVSRIITGKLRLDVQTVTLADVIEAALDMVRPAAQAKAVRLSQVLDSRAGPVAGDTNRLQQVVWNLLSNAVKFAPKGGRVQIELRRVNSHIEIIVTDSGVGIAPEVLPYVFERFRQADSSTTRVHGGLGLGLAIVRQLTELHGGTVTADSPGPGQGATFTVYLPVRSVNHTDAGGEGVHPATTDLLPRLAELPRLDGMRVLVVDDEPDSREMIKAVLELCGADVVTAVNAAEAFALVQRSQFNAMVSDIGMPLEDGYSLIRRVRTLSVDSGGRVPAAAL
ncbi:MAG: CBS domain-containing protein, partial [Gemmatimonadaceae bacterium]|nr:CBS domain-containing protein [Gloeobacterales cyanobacterium ES-bin-141]